LALDGVDSWIEKIRLLI